MPTPQNTPSPSSGPVSLVKGRPTTLKDVAMRAGVSQAAVSVVLRGKEGKIAVSTEVRERILLAANELDYRRSRSARLIKMGRTNLIGFVTTNFAQRSGKLANHVTYPFMVGLNQGLIGEDFRTVMVDLRELEAGSEGLLPPALRERMFDGLVVQIGLSPRAVELIKSCGLPTVFLDSGISEPERSICRDESQVGRVAAELLLDLGHRRIAFFHTARHWHLYQNARHVIDHHSFVARIEGFESALRSRGLEPIHLVNEPAPQALARRLKDERISAVIFGGGQVLPGSLMQALIAAGLRVPEDISLLSCDVEARLGSSEFEMGGVLFDRFEAGYAAAKMILRQLSDPAAKVPSLMLPIVGRLGSTVTSAREPG